MDEPTPHDYDDVGDARASRDSAGEMSELDVHPDSSGWQTPLGVFCPASGGTTVFWRSGCLGLREFSEGGFTSYTPQRCPLNGVWMRRFDAEGQPLSDAKVVVRTFSQWYLPWEPVVALPDGRFVLASDDRFFVVDADGNVQGSATTGAMFDKHRHDCGAGADRCAFVRVSNWLVANVYAADDPEDRLGLVVRKAEETYEPPLDITIRASSVSFACGADGICLAVYPLVREEEDWDEHYEDWIPLGLFGRAFNVHTGEVGPEIEMTSGFPVNVGPGRFVTIENSDDGGGRLRSIVVH